MGWVMPGLVVVLVVVQETGDGVKRKGREPLRMPLLEQ
jgi:hypothetical protein